MVPFSQRMTMKDFATFDFVEYGATMSFEIPIADASPSVGPFKVSVTAAEKEVDRRAIQ